LAELKGAGGCVVMREIKRLFDDFGSTFIGVVLVCGLVKKYVRWNAYLLKGISVGFVGKEVRCRRVLEIHLKRREIAVKR
jgi:hypothetical protein